MRGAACVVSICLMAALAADGAGAAGDLLEFSKVAKMPWGQTQEMVRAAQELVGDQVQLLDLEQAYQALDRVGKPYAYFILNKELPSQQAGGMLGLISLGSFRSTNNIRWIWADEGDKGVQLQKLQPKGSKAAGIGYGEFWAGSPNFQQGPYYQQCQQQQGPVQIGWQVPDQVTKKWTPGKPNPPKYQSEFGCVQIKGQQQGWTFKCPPPNEKGG